MVSSRPKTTTPGVHVVGVVEPVDDTPRDAHGHKEPEEEPTGLERRPDGTIQDTMIRLKVGCRTTPHNLENRRDSPLARSKDSTGHEDFHMLPHRA